MGKKKRSFASVMQRLPRASNADALNAKRAENARAALRLFQNKTGACDEFEDCLVDLLADLMHWARADHPNAPDYFEHKLESARRHFNEELNGEE